MNKLWHLSFNQYMLDFKGNGQTYLYQGKLPSLQPPWGPSTDSEENVISKITFLFGDCFQGQFTSHPHTQVSLPHLRICFYRFELRPMETSIEQVHILTILKISFMSCMFLKTNNNPLNNKLNYPCPNWAKELTNV